MVECGGYKMKNNAMILTGHQPVYLSWLGLFHKIALADKFIFLDTVQYLKKDWNNRNKIKTANGIIWLTVPIITKGKFEQDVCDTYINNQMNWREKHWKSIHLNYKKAKYFDDYKDFFEGLYKKEWNNLTELNREITKYLLKVLGIKTEWIEAKELGLKGIHGGTNKEKTNLIIEMCKKTKCINFIFGTLGRDYAHRESFDKENIRIYFQDYNHPMYEQLWGKFESHLSVIDLLFNHGPESMKIIMQNNILKEELEEKFKSEDYRPNF